jgi:hypothetical protein
MVRLPGFSWFHSQESWMSGSISYSPPSSRTGAGAALRSRNTAMKGVRHGQL